MCNDRINHDFYLFIVISMHSYSSHAYFHPGNDPSSENHHRTALKGRFLELAPTYTVLGYLLMTQSWDTGSQLERSRRVIWYVNVSDSPGSRIKPSTAEVEVLHIHQHQCNDGG